MTDDTRPADPSGSTADNNPYADLEKLQAFVAGALDQHGAVMHQLAFIVADYFRTLLANGCDLITAQHLTADYQELVVQRLLYGDRPHHDDGESGETES